MFAVNLCYESYVTENQTAPQIQLLLLSCYNDDDNNNNYYYYYYHYYCYYLYYSYSVYMVVHCESKNQNIIS